MPIPSLSPATIVAVDDNADDLALVCHLLAKAGVVHPVRRFQCSQTAFTHLRACAEAGGQDLPCGVLIDGNMPGIDGLGLLDALRSLPVYAKVKLIIVSGSDRREDRARAMEHGADAYFVKFPSPEELGRALLLPEHSIRGN